MSGHAEGYLTYEPTNDSTVFYGKHAKNTQHAKSYGITIQGRIPGADPGFLERGFICIKVWGGSL